MQYLQRLLHLIRLRVAGESIDTEVSVDELNEIRIALERMRPLEKAVAYSVDKLLSQPTAAAKSATSTTHSSQRSVDPLQFRPNALDLLPTSTIPAITTTLTSSEHPAPHNPGSLSPPSSPAPTSPSRSGLYRPPHHIPTLPSGSTPRNPRLSARSTRLVQSLYSDLSSAPEEIRNEGSGYGEMNERAASDEERTEYEERMMVRLIETREEKRKKRERERRKALEDVEDFDELRRFVEGREQTEGGGGGGSEEGRRGRKRERGGGGEDERGRVDDLFNGVEAAAGPRKRSKFSSKGGQKGSKKKKGKGGGRRRN